MVAINEHNHIPIWFPGWLMCCSTSSAIILILLSAFSECSLSCTPSPLLWEFYQYRNTSNQQNVCIICPKI